MTAKHTIVMTAEKTGHFKVARKPRSASRSAKFTAVTNPKEWSPKVVAALSGLEPGQKNVYVEDGNTTWRVSVKAV